MRKLTKITLRNKADGLLQEYIKIAHREELCWFCGERPIFCGHHFIYKSQSNSCRYYISNIIPLCRECHRYAHTWQNLFNAKIVLKLGQEWLDDIEARRKEMTKFTLEWIKMEYDILKLMCKGKE